jgi:hypothetical protein
MKPEEIKLLEEVMGKYDVIRGGEPGSAFNI